MDELEALLHLHRGLPRQAPGSDETTRRALALLPPLGPEPRALDLGCGPGRSALILAQDLRARVIALDLIGEFLRQLTASARVNGLEDRITPLQADMAEPGLAPMSLDLIWSEGALYIMGLRKALAMCFDLLRPGGCLGLSELVWFGEERPAPAEAFWQEAYPEMTEEATRVAQAQGAGYQVLGQFRLPAEDWWTEYYTPLSRNLDAAEAQGVADPVLEQTIAEERREMEIYSDFSSYYGYLFLVLRRPA